MNAGGDHIIRTACPYCGYRVDACTNIPTSSTRIDAGGTSGGHAPFPGALSVCIRCSEVSEFSETMELRALDENRLSSDNAELVARARKAVREIGYAAAAERCDRLVGQWLSTCAEAPRFAMPPREMALIGDLGDVGACFVRNDSAAGLLAQLAPIGLARNERPTVMMLRVALERRGIPMESVTLGELGMTVMGSQPGRPS